MTTTRFIPYWTKSIFSSAVTNHWSHIELSYEEEEVTLRLTISQSVSKSWCMTRYLLLFDSYGLVSVGRPFWREDGSVFCVCCWPWPAQSFSSPSLLVLATIFCCLKFETPPTTRRVTVEVFDPASTRVWTHLRVNYDSFVTSRQPECRSPSQTVPLLLCVIRCHGNLCLPKSCLAYELPAFWRCYPKYCIANSHSPSQYEMDWIKNV
jgi:hypothetical protein